MCGSVIVNSAESNARHKFKGSAFLSLDLPHKKKGPPYTADFIITKDSNPTVEEGLTGRPDFVVFQKATPIVVIEVKVVIPVEFFKVKPHDCIELLIYCFYLMRLHKRDTILGVLTDGESWHVLKLMMQDSRLKETGQ